MDNIKRLNKMTRLRNIILYRFLASLLFLFVLFYEGIGGVFFATLFTGILFVLICLGINSTSIYVTIFCFILSIVIFISLIRLIIDTVILFVLESRKWIDNNIYLKRYFGIKLWD
jgi:hypothetical protein